MIKNKKIFSLLLFLLVISSINIKEVKADPSGVGSAFGGSTSASTSSGGGDGGGDGGGGSGNGCTRGGSCTITKQTTIWDYVYIEAYDIYGNKINEGLNILQKTLAGTHIGLNIYEEAGFTSIATYTYTRKEKKVLTCLYVSTDPCAYRKNGRCVAETYTRIADADCSCDGGSPIKTTWVDITNQSDVDACAARAVPDNITIKPSHIPVYRDSNDIDKSSDESNDETMCGTPDKPSNKDESNKKQIYGERTATSNCIVKYNKEKVCMNRKTGNVKYVSKNKKCENEYFEIPAVYDEEGNLKYWKYFVPLDANSKDGFSFSLNTSDYIHKPGICEDIIDKNDNYSEIIIRPNMDKYEKINEQMTEFEKQLIKERVKGTVRNDHGCKYHTEITIPIIQRFYNEINEGNNFQGFNFYYKPIDIDNPFPNGLTDTSLWYDWKKDTDKEPDIRESYKNLTYYANTSEYANWIRNDYSKTAYPYTSWKLMNLDGTSQFVRNNGIMDEKKVKLPHEKLIYNLGCGPWNEKQTNEDGSKNYFYQPECGKK